MDKEQVETTTKRDNKILYYRNEYETTEHAMCCEIIDIVTDLRKEIEDLKSIISNGNNKTGNKDTAVYNININLPRGE